MQSGRLPFFITSTAFRLDGYCVINCQIWKFKTSVIPVLRTFLADASRLFASQCQDFQTEKSDLPVDGRTGPSCKVATLWIPSANSPLVTPLGSSRSLGLLVSVWFSSDTCSKYWGSSALLNVTIHSLLLSNP